MCPRQPQRRAIVLVVWATFAPTLLGCDGHVSPTEPHRVTTPSPLPGPIPTPTPTWTALWSFDRAEPADDCLADALNDYGAGGGMQNWPFALTVEREGDGIRLEFQAQADATSEGFWPVVFAGTVGADGRVTATVPATAIGFVRTDPWLELCYGSWSGQGGELTAVLSADGRRLEGTIVERFRAITQSGGGPTFTIRSRFSAAAR